MIFRQLFDRESSTSTYLIADERSREAVLIDPVLERLPSYVELINQLELELVLALDTHLHADHVTGLGELRDRLGCATVMGANSRGTCVSKKVHDGESIRNVRLQLEAMYTPGHTDDR